MGCCKAILAWIVFGVILTVATSAPAEEYLESGRPRTIVDVGALLDKEKPDAQAAIRTRIGADAEPAPGLSGAARAEFYFARAHARNGLGRFDDALKDADQAIDAGRNALDAQRLMRMRMFRATAIRWIGRPRQALPQFQALALEASQNRMKGWQFFAFRNIVQILIGLGDLEQAETYVRRAEALLVEARNWKNYELKKNSWIGNVLEGRGRLLDAKGKYAEAEENLRRAHAHALQAEKDSERWPERTPLPQMEYHTNYLLTLAASVRSERGQAVAAEIDIRKALSRHLKTNGKYSVWTHEYLRVFARILMRQGRYLEAERLARASLEIQQAIGVPQDSGKRVEALTTLAAILTFQKRWQDAAEAYADIDQAAQGWDATRRGRLDLKASRILTFYMSGQAERGLAASEALVAREKLRVGDRHFDMGVARGLLAIGLMRANRDAEAGEEFRRAIPLLLAPPEAVDSGDADQITARNDQVKTIIENYMALLARPTRSLDDGAAETFPLGEAIRSHAVQNALTAAAFRMAVKGPLENLVRTEQDLDNQIGAQLNLLNDVLSLPAGQVDEKTPKEIGAQIVRLQTARQKAHQELVQRFPNYVAQREPQAPRIEDVQAALRPDEVLASFYVGHEANLPGVSFLWAITKTEARWVKLPVGAKALGERVAALRCGLDSSNWVAGRESDVAEAGEKRPARESKRARCMRLLGVEVSDADLPPFSLTVAHELYRDLFGQIEDLIAGKALLIAPSGPLTQIPFQALAVAAPAGGTAGFDGYRGAQWLGVRQAITVLPSAASLPALRKAGPSAADQPFIGFGNPLVTGPDGSDRRAWARQDCSAMASIDSPRAAARAAPRPLSDFMLGVGVGVDVEAVRRAEPLPETADELCAVARHLGAPDSAVHLGGRATVGELKILSGQGALARARVVHFATHGLIPSDLARLSSAHEAQSALMLTPPDQDPYVKNRAASDDDGVLRASQVLDLKLDADWVVMSACNTAAGGAEEAEALSGLARAFFFAGARALLVSHWYVRSDAAVEITTGAFAQLQADASIGRAEALRRSVAALIAKGGDYAHPSVWAPFVIVGEGGR